MIYPTNCRPLTAATIALLALTHVLGISASDEIGARKIAATPIGEGTLFVSPDGSGTGRIPSDPCGFEDLDLSKGKLRVEPGDVVFFRGGVYLFSMGGARRVYLKGGSAREPVVYESYPGELAIFDGSLLSTGDTDDEEWREGRLHLRGEHAILRNVEIRNMPTYGVRILGNHNLVEGCKIHDNRLSGIGIANGADGYSTEDSGGSYNIIRDCTIFDNSDVGLTHHNYGDGDNADGVVIHSGVDNVVSHNTITGNSDDGIDTWRSMGSLIAYNVVSGSGKGPRGNGNGIKLGGAAPDSPLGTGAIARHNISHSNKMSGFNVNSGKGVIIEYNTAFANGDFGYAIMPDSVLLANLSLDAKSGDVGWSEGESQKDNSWQNESPLEVLSTDPTSRDFLRPGVGSGFANAGAHAVGEAE